MERVSLNILLIVEGGKVDERRLGSELALTGFAPNLVQVMDENHLRTLLAEREWDAVIADFASQQIGGLDALRIVREVAGDTPFILIASVVDEIIEKAFRMGVNDYVLRSNLGRIGSILRRESQMRNLRNSRARAEEALQESSEKLSVVASLLQSSMEAMLEGVLIHDAAGRVLIFNKHFIEFTGLDGASVSGGTWDEVASQIKAGLRNSRLWDELMTSPVQEVSPYRMIEHKDLLLEVCATPCLRNGKYEGRIWRFRDVTERERTLELRRHLEYKLNQAQKMEALGVLAGGMAHDFNNFLAVILNNAELVRAGVEAEGKVKHNMDNLLEALEHAAVLVRQVLQFSHRDRMQEFKEVSLREILPDWIQQLREKAGPKIAVKIAMEPDVPAVLGDANQLRQAVANIFENAVQAMDGAGEIEVGLKREFVGDQQAGFDPDILPGTYVVLSIADNGPGMAPATLPRIFEPFFTTKPVGSGTGLGLPVVHGIVRTHRGAVLAESELGKGAVFRIYLPGWFSSDVGFTPSDLRPTEKKTSLATNGGRILVVDDDEAIAAVTAEILELLGFSPITFTDPSAALAAFKENPNIADLVLADVNMPGMDGVMLSRAILDQRATIPILLLSGYSGPWTADMVKSIGVREMLAKPISADALGKAIRRELEEAS